MKDMLLESYRKNAWLFDRLLGEGVDPVEEEEDTEEEVTDDQETEDTEETSDDTDDTNDVGDDIVDLEDIDDSEEGNEDLEGRVSDLEDKVEALDHSDDDEVFDIDMANPVCPCCGARLNIKGSDSEEFADMADKLIDTDDEPEQEDEPEIDDTPSGEDITFADDDFLDKGEDTTGDYVDLTSMFTDDTDNKEEDEE